MANYISDISSDKTQDSVRMMFYIVENNIANTVSLDRINEQDLGSRFCRMKYGAVPVTLSGVCCWWKVFLITAGINQDRIVRLCFH